MIKLLIYFNNTFYLKTNASHKILHHETHHAETVYPETHCLETPRA